MMITDFETWMRDVGGDRLFRFLVYKRSYTPYERREAFIDQSEFDDISYRFGRIEEAIDLGNGDWLLGIREELDFYTSELLTYYRLSEIRITWREKDTEEFDDPEEDDDEG